MSIKKLIGQIHLWLGLASGIVVVIVSITGCMYAFVEELKPLVYADRLFVEVPSNTAKLPLSVLKEKAQAILGADKPIANIEIPNKPEGSYAFRTRKFNKEAIWYGNSTVYHERIYLNPYTGALLKHENTKWEFFILMVQVHISLLLGHEVGSKIVAWSIAMFVILLITGLVLWWPKNKNATKQRVWFKWKDTTKWKRKNYDLHNILGFYALLILLVISMTGLIWSFEWVSDSVQWIANGGKTYEKPKPLISDTTQLAAIMPLDRIVDDAMSHSPQARTFILSIPQDRKAPIGVFARLGQKVFHKSVRSQYDQHTTKLMKRQAYEELNNGEKMRALNYDLHVGGILGLPGKFLAFCASLISASLPITGFYVWWNKRNKEKKTPKSTGAQKKKKALKTIRTITAVDLPKA